MFFHKHREQLNRIENDEEKILYLLTHRLTSIQIVFLNPKGDCTMSNIALTVGQLTVASVLGFDQNGNPYLGTIPTPSYSIDQPTIDSIAPDATNPANEDVTSLAAGTANLTATVQGPNGPLTATGQITNTVPQVLSSIQLQFSTPTAPVVAPAATKAA